jgi:hypothetical protein
VDINASVADAIADHIGEALVMDPRPARQDLATIDDTTRTHPSGSARVPNSLMLAEPGEADAAAVLSDTARHLAAGSWSVTYL